VVPQERLDALTRRIVVLALLMLGLVPVSANADATTVAANADTLVRSDQPATTFGSSTLLDADGSPVRESYLRFNSVPAGATGAVLKLHLPFPTVESYQIRSLSCSTWTETGTTYNTKPVLGTVVANGPTHAYANVPTTDSITLPAPPSGSACYAITKTASNWMTVSSRESANDPLLAVTYSPAPTPTPTPSPTPTPTPTPPPATVSPVAKCSGTPVNVTPATIASTIASRDNVVVNAAPGNYGGLNLYPNTTKTCVEIRCSADAKVGDFSSNPGGCRLTGQSDAGNIRNLTIEKFVFVTSDDYGLAVYDQGPYVGMKVRLADNAFNGNMLHDISTKNRVLYTEVLNNYFISCQRHCWEIGQNGNIRTRWSTTGDAIFKGNTVSSRIQGVTQRHNLRLTVEGNEFRAVAGFAVITEPYWALYPFGDSGDNGALYVSGSEDGTFDPLRTSVINNSFSAGNRLYFTGRGSLDDSVLLKGNTGTVPSCTRGGMNSRNSGTSAAHINEQTLNPPSRDASSDIGC
jgi:hypothetical protein